MATGYAMLVARLLATAALTLQRQFRLYIPFLGIARPRSQFPHSCVFERFIYIPGSVYIFPPAEQADPSWEYIIRSQTHECGNWDWGPDIAFLGIFVSNFRHFVFAVQSPSRFQTSLKNAKYKMGDISKGVTNTLFPAKKEETMVV